MCGAIKKLFKKAVSFEKKTFKKAVKFEKKMYKLNKKVGVAGDVTKVLKKSVDAIDGTRASDKKDAAAAAERARIEAERLAAEKAAAEKAAAEKANQDLLDKKSAAADASATQRRTQKNLFSAGEGDEEGLLKKKKKLLGQ